MFATLTEKLILVGVSTLAVVVGILGFIRHERTQGAAVCIQQQSTAAATQNEKDASDVKDVLHDFSGDLSAITIAASHTPAMFMCDTPSSVPQRLAPSRAKPIQAPSAGISDPGVQARVEQRRDIGPAVQDIALECVLGITNAAELWNLAVKESSP